ncbi:50S ribosomal protein L15e [Candidatus Woesearchaeota archaeon]|nr:50S ribosomal protein L15e [Candidatus Woesearchaeota archaeon]
MGYLKYVREAWKKPKSSHPELWRQRLIAWRQDPSTLRIDHPTRPDRARSLGFRAKQGFFIVRQRVERGGHTRSKIGRGGRKSKHARLRMVLSKSYARIAEERAGSKYANCEVLNSYWLAKDGAYYWFEIIMVDKNHPAVLADPRIRWIHQPQHTGRVFRGLTNAGKHGRALFQKGKGVEKARPSINARGGLLK